MINQEGRFSKFVESLEQVSYSGSYASHLRQQVMYITERAVFCLYGSSDLSSPPQLMLLEIAPGIDLENDVLAQMAFRPLISPALKLMDQRLFNPALMGFSVDLQRKPRENLPERLKLLFNDRS